MSYNGIQVNHIVATDLNGCIGKDGKIPWHISEDLKRFKRLTEGGVVIMGRKTFESLGCKPLPNRTNIVISRNRNYCDKGYDDVHIKKSVGAAMDAARNMSFLHRVKEIWIIGGAEIYAQTAPYIDVIERTIIHTEIEGGNAFYPIELTKPPYRPVELSHKYQDSEDGLVYQYSKYVKFLSSEVQDGKA